MAPGAAAAFEYHWRYRARPEQLPPGGSWQMWLLMAGRGFGKTRCGAEYIRAAIKSGYRRCGGATMAPAEPPPGQGPAPPAKHWRPRRGDPCPPYRSACD